MENTNCLLRQTWPQPQMVFTKTNVPFHSVNFGEPPASGPLCLDSGLNLENNTNHPELLGVLGPPSRAAPNEAGPRSPISTTWKLLKAAGSQVRAWPDVELGILASPSQETASRPNSARQAPTSNPSEGPPGHTKGLVWLLHRHFAYNAQGLKGD